MPHCFEVSFAYIYLKVDWVGSRDSGRVVREGEREGGDHPQLINCLSVCVCVCERERERERERESPPPSLCVYVCVFVSVCVYVCV